MKYWRGYLVAGILAALTWGLTQFADAHRALVDMIYPYVTRTVMSYLADWSSGVSFCLWQVFLLILAVGAIASVVLMVILRWNPIQWFGWILAMVSCVYLLHTGIYGLNYYAGPITEDVQLNVTEYTVTELEQATVYFRDQANALAAQVGRDEAGNVQFPSFEELAQQAGEGFKVLTYEEGHSVFAGSRVPVKKLGWADMYTSMGIGGITIGITGEAAVNPQLPAMGLPFTMCHEMSHRMSITIEQDANFAAFLACRANPSAEFRYSGYFMAYRYCYNALASLTTVTAQSALDRVSSGVSEQLKQDLATYNAQVREGQDENATRLASSANDTYLKASGDERGTGSYEAVSDYLVSWYVQEFILPLHKEEESVFDPLDKTQVDLSGIVNAK